MIRRLVSPLLLAAFVLAPQGASARPDDHRQERRDDREDRRAWKEHDQREKQYWKEQKREARGHQPHRYFEDERHDQGRRPIPPPWMNSYWRAGESRRYVALVPGDPSRMYVFLEGRWLLRQVRDPRARLDLEGAFRLPMAAPPVPPPHLGLNLHVVLFN